MTASVRNKSSPTHDHINLSDPSLVEYSQRHNSELEGALQLQFMTQAVTEEVLVVNLEFRAIISVDLGSRLREKTLHTRDTYVGFSSLSDRNEVYAIHYEVSDQWEHMKYKYYTSFNGIKSFCIDQFFTFFTLF